MHDLYKEKYNKKGEETRRVIVGDEYVDTYKDNIDRFDAEWQLSLNNQLWSTTWTRGILPHHELSLINMAMLASSGHMEEFELHLRIALTRTNIPLEKIRELLLHIGHYFGVPVGRELFNIAKRVFRELDIDVSNMELNDV